MPFFSVIIPLYNKQEYILATLNSVLEQKFQDFEVIIIDDGTTDQSVDLVKGLGNAKIQLLQQKNQGVSVARNNGIAAAKGNYMALLDADDIWLPNHLESLYKLIHQFPEAGLFCSRYAIKYSATYTKDIIFSQPIPEGMSIIKDYFASSLINPIAWTSAVAFKKVDFLAIGSFDPQLNTAEDMDLFIRFVINHPVAFSNDTTMVYSKNTTYDSLSKVELNEQRYYFINKYADQELNNTSLKSYLDQNRFAVAIRSKIVGDTLIYKKLVRDIDIKLLNIKQRILLKLPATSLRFMAKVHYWLIQNKIYIKPLR